jgi:hypothetical protein
MLLLRVALQAAFKPSFVNFPANNSSGIIGHNAAIRNDAPEEGRKHPGSSPSQQQLLRDFTQTSNLSKQQLLRTEKAVEDNSAILTMNHDEDDGLEVIRL